MPSVSQMFQMALQYHQAGNLQQAESLYRQILQIDPRHVDALHLFGVIAQQVGRSDLAVDYIQQALRLNPEFAAAHNNLGNAQRELAMFDEATASYRHALRLQPDYAEAYNNLGIALQDQGKLDEAIANFQQALRLTPHFAEAYSNLGNALRDQGKLDEAVANCRQSLRLKPGFAEAYCNLGNALKDQGKLGEAIAAYQQAVRHKPDYDGAYNNLGNALRDQGKLDEAITNLQQAVRLKPDYAEAYVNLGNALRDQGKLDEAITNLQQALRLKPHFAEACVHLGNVLSDQGKLEEAIACYQQALRLKPHYAEAYINLGNALIDQGKLEEALAGYRRAVALKPDYAGAHCNLGQLLLLMGDLAEGWQEHEWRWQTKQFQAELSRFAQPLWQGNALEHGAILLHAEQGFGDTIQFIRFAALVKQRVGTVLCECPMRLVRLLSSCAGIDRIIPYGEPLPPHDVHAPLMSLPGILKITLETLPADVPYLHTDVALQEAQARELASSTDFKVGVVWQGNPRTWDDNLRDADRRRSFPLAQLEPLAGVPGVRLFSLQMGFGTEQIQELAGRFPIVDLGGSTHRDFSDTAAVMKNLDLVISADTAPLHLAGALGVPVWAPLSTAWCWSWRWLTHREDSPWYPTMRLFRQTSAGDWSDVFARMAQELRGLVRSTGASGGETP